MMVKGNGRKHTVRRCTIAVLATLVLTGSSTVEGPAAQGAGPPGPTLQCLSYERADGCGCGLKVSMLTCDRDRPDLHFFSELYQGAPLWVNLGGRELSLNSHLPRTDSFEHDRRDRWQENYEGENVKVPLNRSAAWDARNMAFGR